VGRRCEGGALCSREALSGLAVVLSRVLVPRWGREGVSSGQLRLAAGGLAGRSLAQGPGGRS
jgi:hypothetical protein